MSQPVKNPSYLKVDSYDSADGFQDDPPWTMGSSSSSKETNTKRQGSLRSAIMVVVCVLIGDMARGILFPTLWLLVLENGGNQFHQGCAVSAFSAGRIVSSPIFGYGSEIFGYRYILMFCNLVIVAGSIVYSFADSIPAIIGAQFIIGFGAGR